MSPRSLIALPVFVFSLLLCADAQKALLCVALANAFGYAWGYLVLDGLILNGGRSPAVLYYLLFVLAVGPFTYVGYGGLRDRMIYLGYPALQIHLFQPLAALTVPAASFAARVLKGTPLGEPEDYLRRSLIEALIGVPAWMFLLTLAL